MTEAHGSTGPSTTASDRTTRVRIPTAVTGFGSAAVTVVSYLLLLGWNREKELVSGTTSEVGPYQPWQVVALVSVLAVVAAVGGWFSRPLAVTVAVPVALTAIWIADAVTVTDRDASIWPVGAVLVAVASLAGTAAVSHGAAALRRRQAAAS